LAVLPFFPPIEPMLARLAESLPEGEHAYEPKWDGFRCLAFAGGGDVHLQSRHGRPLARYFPELVDALLPLRSRALVLDGEIVVEGKDGLDFPALLCRLHPSASRVARLRAETPARLVAFDLLAADGEDLREAPFAARRARLEAVLGEAPLPLLVTPLTRDRAGAARWLAYEASGIDGVVAKRLDLPYRSGKRTMVKVKRERTAECVVAGLRTYAGERAVASLLLGLHDGGILRHVGVASSFPDRERAALFDELAPLAVSLAGHPWEHGFNVDASPVGRLRGSAGRWDPREMAQDWLALRPVRVCEVRYDRLDAARFRHPARFVRWRPDREARSCGLEQLAPVPARGTG
jgi:ATP-dependent DNA ligase